MINPTREGGGRIRILVVEDDPNLRKVLTLVLTREGYVAEGAEDGQRGLDMALSDDWDCILTDTMMPRLDGPEMLRRISVGRKSAPPAILVSAAATIPQPDELLRLGIRRVVTKPFSFDGLLRAVAEVTGSNLPEG
jgi:DNA-binding response OmpR family regulator